MKSPFVFLVYALLSFTLLCILNLKKLLSRKARLCNDSALFFREAIVQSFEISNTDDVANLIPIKIRIYAVRSEWLLLVIKTSPAARKMKTVL